MEKRADIRSDFAQWYLDIIAEAELADHSPTRGAMVIRPYGYAMWENIVKILDATFKEYGVQNAYFPLLIPKSFIEKEAKHVEGFSPELAVVTHAGGKKLDEPLVVRPTSETIIFYMFSKWIKSWRDLPMKLNQWANVVRWEMRPRPFLRTTEFLWQEGHTAHASAQEASEMATTMLEEYRRFAQDYLAIPAITGRKSPTERFAGADETFTFEGMMQDGKALQMGTSHILSKQFSDAFEILYQAPDGSMASPHCSSWGVTTRLIGAVVMVHGDKNGLMIPPKIAPVQAVVIPIYKTSEERAAVFEKAQEVKKNLIAHDIRVSFDDDEEKTPGAKFYHWEVRGVPIRIEIGPRDLEKNQVAVVSRIEQEGASKKQFIPIDGVTAKIKALLEGIHEMLLARAKKFRDEHWHQADSLSDFGPTLEKQHGFFQSGWCGSEECELKPKEYKATIRCLLEEKKHPRCFACDKPSSSDVVIAKAY